jgi:alkylated DNA repair protein (DNA oxidative demethylase)
MARAQPRTEPPDGLVYRSDFLDEDEEARLLSLMDEIEFHEVRMHGVAARRTVAHFGLTYDYESWRLTAAAPIPEPLLALRDRAGELAEAPPERLAQALVTRYPPGATIGWHRDAPAFGPKVVGVSLLSECRMLLRREARGVHERYQLNLAPRSAYVLGGAARSAWQHSIPATPGLRYSVTFRTVR